MVTPVEAGSAPAYHHWTGKISGRITTDQQHNRHIVNEIDKQLKLHRWPTKSTCEIYLAVQAVLLHTNQCAARKNHTSAMWPSRIILETYRATLAILRRLITLGQKRNCIPGISIICQLSATRVHIAITSEVKGVVPTTDDHLKPLRRYMDVVFFDKREKRLVMEKRCSL